VLTAVALGGFAFSWWELTKIGNVPGESGSALSSSCFKNDPGWRCRHGDLFVDVSYGAGIGAAVLAGVSVYAFYRIASAKERPVAGGRRTRARRELTVPPVVSATGGGATVRFDW